MQEFNGYVLKKRVAHDSKQDHEAVCLQVDNDTYVLRRKGANAFSDPALDMMVGKKLTIKGVLHGNTLIFDSYSEKSGKVQLT